LEHKPTRCGKRNYKRLPGETNATRSNTADGRFVSVD